MITSRRHSLHRYAGLVAAASLPVLAPAAQAAPAPEPEPDNAVVTVVGERETYRANTLSSAKSTQPLRDTPQTLSVISREVLAEQGALSLTDALRNTPGVTLQLGENGNTAAGDTFQMRGFSAQSAVFLDGARDLGAVVRDTFTIEQVEVAKGASGADIGRGAAAGYVNMVSKTPHLSNGGDVVISAYSAGGYRATVDANVVTAEDSAFRLNVMAQDIDTPERGPVSNSGYGIAPSFATGLGSDTRVIVSAQYVARDNTPDGGLPTIGMEGYYHADANVRAGERVDRETVYGGRDFEETHAGLATVRVEHDLNEDWRLTNTTRIGESTMERLLTGIFTITAPSADPQSWTIRLLPQKVDQSNRIAITQTNLTGHFTTGPLSHDLATGLEIAHEEQTSVAFSRTGQVIPDANLYNPDLSAAIPDPYITGTSRGSTGTVALYAIDTIHLGEQWLFTLGLRTDSYNTRIKDLGTGAEQRDEGTPVSGRIAALYKPTPASSVYVAWASSATPPGSEAFTFSTSATSVSKAGFKPQTTENLEVGGKWDVLAGKLSLTGALYKTSNANEFAQADPSDPTVFVQYGERVVEGVELGLVGQVTPDWQVIAGLATMKTEITEGTATGNSAEGASARWSPDLSATIWTSYRLSDTLSLGGGARYTSEQKRVVDPTVDVSTQAMPIIPAFWVVDAYARYAVTPSVSVQVNVNNLLDEEYIATLNNSGARMTLGAPRTVTLSLRMTY